MRYIYILNSLIKCCWVGLVCWQLLTVEVWCDSILYLLSQNNLNRHTLLCEKNDFHHDEYLHISVLVFYFCAEMIKLSYT